VLAVISAAVVILTAGYILWTIQRVYLGPEYKGPHAEALRPMTLREIAIAAPLLVMAVVLGVYPAALLNYTNATIGGLVQQLNPARLSAPAIPGHTPLPTETGAATPSSPLHAGVRQGAKATDATRSPLPTGEGQGVRAAGADDHITSINTPSPQPSPGGRGGLDATTSSSLAAKTTP
jgi:hypothetical protein